MSLERSRNYALESGDLMIRPLFLSVRGLRLPLKAKSVKDEGHQFFNNCRGGTQRQTVAQQTL